MSFEFVSLNQVRKNHPGWRLLMADHAPLVASFLDRVLIKPNVRLISQAELASKLEDVLFQVRQQVGDEACPSRVREYLNKTITSPFLKTRGCSHLRN